MVHVLIFILSLPIGLYRAFVFNCMWTWFLTPIFEITAPGVVLCWGVMVMISYSTFKISGGDLQFAIEHSDIAKKLDWVKMVISIVYVSVVWCVAWILHLFV